MTSGQSAALAAPEGGARGLGVAAGAGPFLRKQTYMTLAYVEITATKGNPERDIR